MEVTPTSTTVQFGRGKEESPFRSFRPAHQATKVLLPPSQSRRRTDGRTENGHCHQLLSFCSNEKTVVVVPSDRRASQTPSSYPFHSFHFSSLWSLSTGFFFLTRQQDVGRVQGPQGPNQDQPRHHRLHNISHELLCDCELSYCLLTHCHHQAVCGKSHRLHSHKGDPRGCAQHLLLDPLHLHHSQCLLEADRN